MIERKVHLKWKCKYLNRPSSEQAYFVKEQLVLKPGYIIFWKTDNHNSTWKKNLWPKEGKIFHEFQTKGKYSLRTLISDSPTIRSTILKLFSCSKEMKIFIENQFLELWIFKFSSDHDFRIPCLEVTSVKVKSKT